MLTINVFQAVLQLVDSGTQSAAGQGLYFLSAEKKDHPTTRLLRQLFK